MIKKIFLLSTLFIGFDAFSQPAIYNFSFENWSSQYGKITPTGWQCDSISITNLSVKRLTIASHGMYSIQIGTASNQGSVEGALIRRDDSLTQIPGNLTFDYKIINNLTSEKNGLYIEIYFFDSKKKALKDFNWTSNGNFSDFVNGILPISFDAGQVPKYYTLIISYFNIGGQAGEYTIVDNLKFASSSGSTNSFNISNINLYPNPAIDILNFTHEPKNKLCKVKMIAIDGKASEFPVLNSSVDISGLPKGIYVIELYNTSNEFIKREKVSIVN